MLAGGLGASKAVDAWFVRSGVFSAPQRTDGLSLPARSPDAPVCATLDDRGAKWYLGTTKAADSRRRDGVARSALTATLGRRHAPSVR
jgi:hypothetical protein